MAADEAQTLAAKVRFRGRNRPKDSAWRQQTLRAFRPVLDAKCALVLTVPLAILSLVLSALFFFSSLNEVTHEIDYTNCTTSNGAPAELELLAGMERGSTVQVTCDIPFSIADPINGDINFYYGLTKFYQNNRLYILSRSDAQLSGSFDDTEGCKAPYDVDEATNKTILPCGLVANSMFNDTFALNRMMNIVSQQTESRPVPWTAEGIVPRHVINSKFHNPGFITADNGSTVVRNLCDYFEHYAKPMAWQKGPCEWQETSDDVGVGLQRIDFVVWMNFAALPTFRKPYRRLNRNSSDFEMGLPAGEYILQINYNYPVSSYGGRKRFIISRDAVTGPGAQFLCIAYLAVGIFLLVLSAVLAVGFACERSGRKVVSN